MKLLYASLALVCCMLVGCKKLSLASTSETDSLQLSGQTGRHLNLIVNGINKQKTKEGADTVCGFARAGDDALTQKFVDEHLVCVDAPHDQTSVILKFKDLPYPAYITVFHDGNHNRVLDFGSFNAVIARASGPVEGLAVFEPMDESFKFSRPIWVEVGETTLNAHLVYGDLPFWKFLKEQAWQAFWGWFRGYADRLNRGSTPAPPPGYEPQSAPAKLDPLK
ncbi:hypothetical protein EBU99_04795 [bacterium]|nr:hypothetical protein [bacterium]